MSRSGSDPGRFRRLDVGCGMNKTAGTVGIDRSPASRADLVADCDRGGLPFKSDTFQEIFCADSLEHFENPGGVLEEIHRVGTGGAAVHIQVPHFTSVHAYSDLTHRHFFATSTLDDWIEGRVRYPHLGSARFDLIRIRIQFWKPFRYTGISFLANRFPSLYERFFAFWFPAMSIRFELRVRKGES